VKIRVFWIVTPCNDVVGYQRFGGPCCNHAANSNTTWYQNPENLDLNPLTVIRTRDPAEFLNELGLETDDNIVQREKI